MPSSLLIALQSVFYKSTHKMIMIDGVKFACQKCINGHRSSACVHSDRELVEIKPKGRPQTQCTKCRQKREKTGSHFKCNCVKDVAPRKSRVIRANSGISLDSVRTSISDESPKTPGLRNDSISSISSGASSTGGLYNSFQQMSTGMDSPISSRRSSLADSVVSSPRRNSHPYHLNIPTTLPEPHYNPIQHHHYPYTYSLPTASDITLPAPYPTAYYNHQAPIFNYTINLPSPIAAPVSPSPEVSPRSTEFYPIPHVGHHEPAYGYASGPQYGYSVGSMYSYASSYASSHFKAASPDPLVHLPPYQGPIYEEKQPEKVNDVHLITSSKTNKHHGVGSREEDAIDEQYVQNMMSEWRDRGSSKSGSSSPPEEMFKMEDFHYSKEIKV